MQDSPNSTRRPSLRDVFRWELEYWRSCAICRVVEPRVPTGVPNPDPQDLVDEFQTLVDEFRELLESGCADRLVLDLSVSFPLSVVLAGHLKPEVQRQTGLGRRIALAAADDRTMHDLRTLLRLGDFVTIWPTVTQATAWLQGEPMTA